MANAPTLAAPHPTAHRADGKAAPDDTRLRLRRKSQR